ncbi:sigma-70 family RNA polymerase sigma factor [Clostridium sp. LIBA-8841]|uniref:sigma-70 family RNA polymerase sigma factor n=1 Tax=Clostridium sp. LIBA-8841 TaxID=2987530 RepID=UPI002AC688B2|nr:sigma-70 family RNA polymerase sigma factor [Clostridium sp. LIBA-8841]EGT3616422.1 sigma-70 family RNA polymerase sigma factor [Clostridium perfringens]MDZ5253981.1 sigma-70 family RNA polymerase sigma factor [Clostridium sp. LIBA-8841]
MKENNFISQLKKKNPKALDHVFENYGNLIFKVAYSVLNNRELSEECVNDVLLKIWNNIDSFNKGDEQFKAWIIVMTKYTSIDILRKEKKHDNVINLDSYEKEDTSLESFLENKETKENILSMIKTFDKENREIFIKRFFLNYSIKEISKSIGISENAISNRIRRGKFKLSEFLKERRF